MLFPSKWLVCTLGKNPQPERDQRKDTTLPALNWRTRAIFLRSAVSTAQVLVSCFKQKSPSNDSSMTMYTTHCKRTSPQMRQHRPHPVRTQAPRKAQAQEGRAHRALAQAQAQGAQGERCCWPRLLKVHRLSFSPLLPTPSQLLLL